MTQGTILIVDDEPNIIIELARMYLEQEGFAVIAARDGQTRTVDVHVAHLRAKLERAGSTVQIETVWGVGYKLVAP